MTEADELGTVRHLLQAEIDAHKRLRAAVQKALVRLIDTPPRLDDLADTAVEVRVLLSRALAGER